MSIPGHGSAGEVNPPLISFEAACAYLDVPPNTLRHWLWRASRGECDAPRSYKIGRHRRFRLTDLDAFLERQAEES